ncbi:MAG: hypothetical protein HYU66_18975 [Armatimonadetes bacterium]|nr:hypothetical protein [Armatimonadota bacterium]
MLPFVYAACLPLLATADGPATAASYSLGTWPAKGHGNHRAIVRVEAPAPAVWAHIEWRRRDPHPETKAVLVVDAATGQPVRNVVRVHVEREFGDIVFQPATAPGSYAIYYLPYNPGSGNFDDAGTYFKPEDTADPAWVAANHLATPDLAALPRATLVDIQARSEFNRMDPMEVIATADETRQLLAEHSEPYLVFPEDRRFPAKMIDDLPQRWILRGPGGAFAGQAQPGEWYVFQLGLYAAHQPLGQVALECAELRNQQGKVIPRTAFECINLAGRDWLGRPVHPKFEVGEGKVRALWVGVAVPESASGVYTGSVTVRPEGLPATKMSLSLDVSGAVLKDHGDSELWRLSRLRWLNSSLGLEDEVVPPFTRVVAKGDTVSLLNRRIRFGPDGLPASIVSNGREVLARPISFVAELAAGSAALRPGASRTVAARTSSVDRESRAAGDGFEAVTTSRTEMDGAIKIETVLTTKRDADLRDIRLEVPLRRDVATYLMGMSCRGGYRPKEWSWKWDLERSDNSVWIGEVDAGLQLKLLEDRDAWHWNLHDTGLPVGWSNGGKGGARVTENGDEVLLSVYTGERKLRAGESLTFRYRFIVTPLKPVDPIHWSQRYGPGYAGGNIEHVHHGCPQNPYINYPFITAPELKQYVDYVRGQGGMRRVGRLEYPAPGNLDPRRGTLHLWAKLLFDPSLKVNRNLFDLTWPNQDEVGFYWNLDDLGMRVYIRHGSPANNQYRIVMGSHSPEWKEGESHLLSFSWGDALRIFVDGRKVAEQADFPGLLDTPLDGATLKLDGPFGITGLKITDRPYQEGAPIEEAVDDGTLLLDTFSHVTPPGVTQPERSAGGGGRITGGYQMAPQPGALELRFTGEPQKMGVNVYYTVRELSDHVAEMWPLRSLGGEVFETGQTLLYSDKGATLSQAGGGYPWLQEHLVSGYTPAWRQPLWNGETDAAIGTKGLSRWHNYYIEGLGWLMRNTGVDGLYLDGIGYDREIMKRVARVMRRANPGYRINFHCGNDYDYLDHHVSPLNEYLEHLPYMTTLWIGEMYDYNRSPDYWLVEISGLPFGLTSEMLNYENGGNAYRGMVYGMSGRQHPSAPAMWRLWDEWGIEKSEMMGYWRPECPVRTNQKDVLATVYRQKGKALICLASWHPETVAVRLRMDWKALGLDPRKVKLGAPGIDYFQAPREFGVGGEISVEAGKGWVIEVE